MTEITETKPLPFDPVAFVAALVLAPFLVTLVTCITIIPVFALVIGGPIYLIVGTPTLLWMVGRFPPVFSPFALAGLTAMVVLVVLAAVANLIRPEQGWGEMIPIFLWGFVFAPIWAGTFAPLYRVCNRQARFVI